MKSDKESTVEIPACLLGDFVGLLGALALADQRAKDLAEAKSRFFQMREEILPNMTKAQFDALIATAGEIRRLAMDDPWGKMSCK